MKRRLILQALAAAPALRGQPELRVAVNRTTIESAPLLVLKIPGVAVIPVASGRVASAQLVSGEVDAATGSETQALVSSVAQPDLRIVLTLAECRYRIVARTSAAIRSVADLRGKRVATTANTSAQYFLAEMLRTSGLTESDVRLVFLEGPVMPDALSKHDVDAISIWEPHAQNAREILAGDAQVLENTAVYHERFNLNTTLAVLHNPAKRRRLVALIQSVMRTSGQLQVAPRDQLPALANAISTPERVIEAVWGQFRFPAALDAMQLRAVLEAMEPWAAAVGRRKPRSRQTLAALIEGSLWYEARR